MGALEYFKDDMLLEIGRIATLRGSLRSTLLGAMGVLLSTGLRDQELGWVLAGRSDIPEICRELAVIAEVRDVPRDVLERLASWESVYKADFDLASAIANGTWTLLAGGEEPCYGLFESEATVGARLEPKWRRMAVADLRGVRERLEGAWKILEPIAWAVEGTRAKSEREGRS